MVICGQDGIYHVMSYDTGQLLAHFNVIIDYVVGLKQWWHVYSKLRTLIIIRDLWLLISIFALVW